MAFPRSLVSSIHVTVTRPLPADQVDGVVWINTTGQTLELIDIAEVHTTKEAAGTLGIMPERCQGTEAPGSGDDLLSAGFDGTAAINTVQNGTLVTTTVVRFADGDRLALDYTGDTAGELAGVCVTARFRAVAS